ncbi:unnamed protein product [Didymodactylos carnosus]|uniref:Uncharacterized protein n=1 Tax=Didymodactylos carnosus TaxID=1234261 RepID=A0A815AB25_9BILA|nr:unnamed protein product [Didymodactylos carnosus]CAF1254680.1 unnamed protein product [Didymodactylos carnosus]CAF3824571.1 unnamed protein product [Didymodactylos carnosus]CAF4026218.1 unnamed protein product [Didymodactylos carnosus]
MSSTYSFDLTRRLTTNPTLQSSRRISRLFHDTSVDQQQLPQQLLTVPWRRQQSYQQHDIVYNNHLTTPKVKQEPTYSLTPEKNKKFDIFRVRKLINNELNFVPHTIKYDSKIYLELIKDLTVQLKKSIRDVTYSRYKIVVIITGGQNNSNQTLIYASRCLWDKTTDGSLTVNYKVGDIYLLITVYFVYTE